ncbi:DEAD/DEAH box helicase family protein [Candidatus Peregrinibacteria bacterium]|nr:DEAD/DEAH box helicase family protein [Candidatus Peregrinibacteria bacterium]
MFSKPFVVLDLETSGIDPKRDDIIEVAMIRYENGRETARYDDLIKIGYELPEIITIITGITDKDLKEKGKEREVVFAEVEKVVQGAYIVAHNSSFDVGFLKAKGVKLDILGVIDSIPLAQILMPEKASYSLESLTDDLNISHKEKHRAMGDVEATLDLLKHLWKLGGDIPKASLDEIKEFLPRAEWDASIFFEELKGASKSRESKVEVKPETLESNGGVQKAVELDEFFGENGPMRQVLDGSESRPQQVEMAQNVLSAFQEGYHLICEAPTGVGKSLAYLSAAAHMAISNKSKVVISTNTINLQEQLFYKDIPLLQSIYKEATGHNGVRAAILKGRSHYLCLRRLAEFKRRPRLTEQELILLIKIIVWQAWHNGQGRVDVHLTREEQLIWDFELSADQQFCTPQKCKDYGTCYLHEARKKAETADIIVVNHALLCADLESEGSLLPDYNYLVVDEAHHFEEVATRTFGVEIKQESLAIPIKTVKNHLEDLKRRFSGTLFMSSKAFESIDSILDEVPELQQALDNFFSILVLFVGRNVPDSGFIEHLLIDKIVGSSEEWMNLGASFEELHDRITGWISALRKFASALELADSQDFPQQSDFTDELMQELMILMEVMGQVQDFFEPATGGSQKLIRWITSDIKGEITLYMAPLMLEEELKGRLYDEKKSVILTSATLGVKLIAPDETEQHPFTYLRQMLGLDDRFEELILESPFDFEKQAYVITPTDLRPVQAKDSINQVSDFFVSLIRAVGGSLLGLFTSHGALERVYLNLMHEFSPKDPKVLAQRISGGRAKVMKAYMNDPTHSALLGTNSFWEGVDIQGEALTTLVIHKLPFDVPSDPIFKARSEMFGNAFMEYSVPRAILRFRQGFGRLIRSQKDYGCMVILDNRVLQKDYGKMFLAALPEGVLIDQMKLKDVPSTVKEWLELSGGREA